MLSQKRALWKTCNAIHRLGYLHRVEFNSGYENVMNTFHPSIGFLLKAQHQKIKECCLIARPHQQRPAVLT